MRIGWLFTPLAIAAAAPLLADAPSVPSIGPIQNGFDEFGPAVQSLKLPSGRTIHYTDTGYVGGRTVLFIGGTGTSARAAGMTDFLGTLRRQLKLRFIVVERNGFGDTEFAPDWGYKDYAAEVQAVLDRLGVTRFAGIAISGGGPYMAAVAGAMPERVISVHMLATAATNPSGKQCKVPLGALTKAVQADVQNPQRWWAFPANSPTHRIPGYADRAFEEGARTFFIRGQMGDATPEAAEMLRYCGPAPDVSKVTAPVYIYHGGEDPLVRLDQPEYWRSHYPNVAAFNVYPGEAHDVQYRHWDQVLIELAGFAGQTVVCDAGQSKVVPAKNVSKPMTLGICAWAKP
jgi:pimeloyl-ACP methyl ester carboxylesterase